MQVGNYRGYRNAAMVAPVIGAVGNWVYNPNNRAFIRAGAQYVKNWWNKPGNGVMTTYRPYYKKGWYRKNKNNYVKINKKKSVKSQIRTIQKRLNSDLTTLIYKRRNTNRLISGVNACNHTSLYNSNVSVIEEALAQCRFFDSSTNTIVTASQVSGTFQRKVRIKNIRSYIYIRNNYKVPAKVTVYSCRVKADTSIDPLTAYTNGLTDVDAAGAGLTSTSPQYYLNDSPQFKDLWKIEKKKTKILQPGQEMKFSAYTKSFEYDPSLVDSHNLQNIKKYHSAQFVIRVEGVLGHDTSETSQQTLLGAGIDYQDNQIVTLDYDGGIDSIFTVNSDGSDATFTNSGVVTTIDNEQNAYGI